MGYGHCRETFWSFLKLFGAQCKYNEALTINMNRDFDVEVKAKCPNAEVDDLFHAIARFGRNVVHRPRDGCCCETATNSRKAVELEKMPAFNRSWWPLETSVASTDG